ncbi:MAG: CoB--CoM heterodisulfide reductase iron-sulfur subunit B family protein [Gemmatimonadales bacterium]
MKKLAYYPGCSLKGTGRAYDESLRAVFEVLGEPLEELDDWNCCGATSYMSIDKREAYALASRNLALAEREKADLLTPCNACYLVLEKTRRHLADSAEMGHRVRRALDAVGLSYEGDVRIRHPLEVLTRDVGEERIKEAVKEPLKGLKVAPYYGCQIVRPYATFDDQYHPQTMDRLLKATGAKVLPYPFKTRCCGASQTGTLPEVGLHLVYRLLNEAEARGADVLAVICPLCQFNLDAYQSQVRREYDLEPIPILYFSQILGLALGIPAKKLGIDRCVVSANRVLERRAAHAA